jgi:pSer/pThr/pTyr-binding forkhead associated (FHA) protein
MPDPHSEGVTLPTLVMTGGPLDGTTYPLATTARDVLLGSGMDADVQIMLGNVEPHHARVSASPTGLSISDAGSATGTFVNGEKVEGSQSLQEGDRICLGPPGAKGSAKLVVRVPPGMTTADATPGGGEAASPFLGGDPGPLIIDDGDQPQLTLEGDSPAPPPAAPTPSPPAEPPVPFETPPAQEATGEEILAAEEVLVDDAPSDPPLVAAEVPPDDTAALFDKPLPPPPAPPPPAGETPGPPPPPPPPAGTDAPLTAPPPPEESHTEAAETPPEEHHA